MAATTGLVLHAASLVLFVWSRASGTPSAWIDALSRHRNSKICRLAQFHHGEPEVADSYRMDTAKSITWWLGVGEGLRIVSLPHTANTRDVKTPRY